LCPRSTGTVLRDDDTHTLQDPTSSHQVSESAAAAAAAVAAEEDYGALRFAFLLLPSNNRDPDCQKGAGFPYPRLLLTTY
jgi:hypothetical protein